MLSFRISCLAVVLSLSALWAQQPVPVFEDTFTDGERSTFSLPGSIAWYQNVPASAGNTQAGNLAVRNGALTFVVNNASRALWTYFPTVNLKVGDRILLLMEFRVTAPVANGFRVGLCNTNGVAPQIGDGPGPAGAYQGYGLENLFTIKRGGPAASDPDISLLSQLSNAAGQSVWDRVSPTNRGIQGIPLQANTPYNLLLSVMRTGADSASITTSLTGPGLTPANNTTTVTDSANAFSSFDTFSVAFVGNALNGDMLVDRAAVFTNGEVVQLNPARLINLSILTSIPTSGESFTMGYVVGGAGTSGPKPLVIRAAGPSLGALGVGGTLDDPKLELFAGSIKSGENDNWGGGADVSAAMAAVGAFAFSPPTSRDAAVFTSIVGGPGNSVQVSANGNGTGTVIAEIYDASPPGSFRASTPRLINVSVRKHLGTGLTMGFVVGGSGVKSVLVRAIGPTLGSFGVDGVVADPRLAVFNKSSTQIASNDNWAGDAVLGATFTKVGAFPLPADSRDAAVVATLQPGEYTVQVSGVNNTTGVALVEVYEVP